MQKFEEEIRTHFQFLDYAPIVFLSAKTEQRLHTLIPLIKQVSESHSKRVATSVLNDVVMEALAVKPTPTVKGKRLKVLYVTEVTVTHSSLASLGNDAH